VTSSEPLAAAGRGRIAILGAGGQLGRALTAILGERAAPLNHRDADLTDLQWTLAALDGIEPTCVINAAAYTNVERAEIETRLAFAINGHAPGSLARWCRERDLPFIHFSTDYVFSGSGERPWTEHDKPDPINTYGQSKLEGEQQVAAAGGRWLIFRTSWAYDDSGRNFLTTILRMARERDSLSIVDDQWGAPTYAAHLAGGVAAGLSRALAAPSFPSGIYHICSEGATTWYGFARAIVDGARALGDPLRVQSIVPISSADYPTAVKRPQNSRLCTTLVERVFGVRLPDWSAGLADCLAARSISAGRR
jgi:dTDP-4-dehydrorhamnose reductase